MKTINARLYVGTYAKYNNGSIGGAWLDLDDYSDSSDFYRACAELHSDEEDPEYMFQDFEGLPRDLYSESGNIEEIYTYIDLVRDSHLNQEIIDAGLELGIPLESIEDAYQGSYDSPEDFAYEMAESCGLLKDNDSWPYTCIDWTQAARELMYDYTACDGHYFADNY